MRSSSIASSSSVSCWIDRVCAIVAGISVVRPAVGPLVRGRGYLLYGGGGVGRRVGEREDREEGRRRGFSGAGIRDAVPLQLLRRSCACPGAKLVLVRLSALLLRVSSAEEDPRGNFVRHTLLCSEPSSSSVSCRILTSWRRSSRLVSARTDAAGSRPRRLKFSGGSRLASARTRLEKVEFSD